MNRPIRPRIRGPLLCIQFQELRAIGAADFRMQLRRKIPEQNVVMGTPGFFTVLRSTEEPDAREASPASFLPQMLQEGFDDAPRDGAVRRKELSGIGESDRYDTPSRVTFELQTSDPLSNATIQAPCALLAGDLTNT